MRSGTGTNRALSEVLSRERARAAAEGLVASDIALMFRGLVRDRVGGFFSNSFVPGAAGICSVCRGPASSDLCEVCQRHRDRFGDLLADRTVLLTYAIGMLPNGIHQSAHHMSAYKGYRGTPRVSECSDDLEFMIQATIDLHRPCLEEWTGAPWDSLTFVPSRERPDTNHPVVALTRAAQPKFRSGQKMSKFLLTPGPGSDTKHAITDDRYTIDIRWLNHVADKHILIVDDTWTTGASAQGAAIAAKTVGAASVTILCVDRWLRWDWPDHKRVIDAFANCRYDVLYCPVDGTLCRESTTFGSQVN